MEPADEQLAEEDHDPLEGAGHVHGEMAGSFDEKPGDARALIARFGHDHGAADIGPITRRNPVGLMKRSISNMWQAELHLMLAEPERALPFEYEALKYLNLARQADRIYTRRLGFEPPPVTEERRLSGELDEILAWTSHQAPTANDGDQSLFWHAYQALNTHYSAGFIDSNEKTLLGRLSHRLAELASERPALILQAVTVEKILLAGSFVLDDCENCVDDLGRKLWALLEEADAQPRSGGRDYLPGDDLVADYLEAVQSP